MPAPDGIEDGGHVSGTENASGHASPRRGHHDIEVAQFLLEQRLQH